MEYKYNYNGLEDRQAKIETAEGLGYMMLTDNFDDPNWKQGDPIIGTLTFTDIIPPSPIIVENPDIITLKKYLADPHSGLPDLETAFIALAKLYLGM